MATTDILVVGAGPTGLMLALQLARRGIRPRIIDRHAGPARETRALGVQARTVEIYQELGLADEALQLGRRATGANLWVGGRHAARVPLGDIGRDLSPFPFLLILGQDDNEQLLGGALRAAGIEIEWRTELEALAQRADSVTARLRRPDGSIETLDARWVAGCDGSHSKVRTENQIGFPGAAYEQVFFVADTEVTGSMRPDELNVYLFRHGFHLFFPLRGRDHWRVVGILPEALQDRADVRFEDVVALLGQEAGTLNFRACHWFSTYRIHHRRAEHFQAKRCFLLGDAAHVHSPVGAQGMNTGLQDAYNLAWKLALVLRGEAGESLLDSYAAEREPVAERLLDTTDRAFVGIAGDNWRAALFRTQFMPRMVAFAMGREFVRQLAFRTISQIGVAYRESPLAENLPGLPADAPRAGERFPWAQLVLTPGGPVTDLFQWRDDRRFQLLAFGQDVAAGFEGTALQTVRISGDGRNASTLTRLRIPARSFYLLRPDGYIGLAGLDLDPAVLVRYGTRLGLSMLAR